VQVFITLFFVFVFSCLAAAIQIELHFFFASESDILIFLKGIEMLVHNILYSNTCCSLAIVVDTPMSGYFILEVILVMSLWLRPSRIQLIA
jgi:hypothetical protein